MSRADNILQELSDAGANTQYMLKIDCDLDMKYGAKLSWYAGYNWDVAQAYSCDSLEEAIESVLEQRAKKIKTYQSATKTEASPCKPQ